MLRSLHIRNYILIDTLDVEFPDGLVIITGQTGAGKSILLGALSLVGGGKSDASMVGLGGENCVVEAEYELPDDSLEAVVEDAGAEWQGRNLILRRVLSSSGRSRCFLNDCPVSVQTLQDISAALVDIHSQHNSLLLANRRFQLSVFDAFSGNTELAQSCAAVWRDLQKAGEEKEKLLEALSRINEESDYNAAQFKQLDEARLRDGELEELEEEHKSLSHVEQIRDAFASALASLSGDDERSIDSALKNAGRQMSLISSFVEGAAQLSSRLESERIELEDIISEMESFLSSLNADPQRLQMVEDRMSLIYSLLHKHSRSSVAELIALRDELSSGLGDSETLALRLKEIDNIISDLQKRHSELCSSLHESRISHAPEFSKIITESMHYLELDEAVFEVGIQKCSAGASGEDEIRFLFSSNRTEPAELSKCASGGELSRIMLCLKSLMASFAKMPTLIFDEIDTGVSGSVADKMGRMICSMGSDMQVISITHLPQVAAKGQAHFVVEKVLGADSAVHSTLRRVSGEERTMEIARLLSGSEITPEAVANAESLLKAI